MTSATSIRAAVLACALVLSACGGAGGDVALPKAGVALFTSANGTINLAIGASVTHTVGGGGGGAPTTAYSATSNNPTIATGSINGDKLTIKALAAGSANIAVLDSSGSGQTVIVPVTVAADASVVPVTPSTPVTPVTFYSTAQAALTINAGASPVYLLGGGAAPYVATTNNAGVATANVTDNKLSITGVASGSATIGAFDATGKSLLFTVTVPSPASPTALYSTAQSAISLPVGATPAYQVAGGTAPYTVTSSNVSVATAAVKGNILTITGVGGGVATIAVFDAAGTLIRTTATVDGGPTIALYTTAPSSLTMGAGAVSYSYVIAGGRAPFTVSSSAPAIASATVSGNSLKITGLASGSASIIVFDALGASNTVSVLVSPGAGNTTPLYSTAQSAISLPVGSMPSYQVAGGTAPYSSTSSNAAVATAAVKDNVLTITGVGGGVATIAVFDAAGTVIRTTATVDGGPTMALYTTAPSPLTMGAGAVSYSYVIAGGKAPFTVSSSAPAIATGAVSGNTLKITGIASGSASIIVFDALGASTTTSVLVSPGAGSTTPLYSTAQNAITVASGSTTTFIAGGGTGPYVVTTDDAAIATASVTGNALTIKAVGLGKVNIRLSDAALASTVISVEVGSATMLYTTSPSSVTIKAGAAPSYTIRGGIGPYVATSSAAGFATVAVQGDVLTISGVSAGDAEVIVLDAAGHLVSIAVTVPVP